MLPVNVQLGELERLLTHREDEHLEFKEARTGLDFETLVKYCVALANEGGGRMILAATDKRPRQVVGSAAFRNIESTKANVMERVGLRVDLDEVPHPDGRVVVVIIPSRPLGVPIHYKGAYLMRSGESLVAMTPDRLRQIFDETVPDFSAELCPRATLADLDPAAIERLRALWTRKSANEALERLPAEQILADAELLVQGQVTYAALALLGTRASLGRHLGQAEVILEYRSGEAPGPAQQRVEFRQGILTFLDALWDTINLRNDLQHFQDGLFVWDVPTFNERAVREAILNAVVHRDYRRAESVFVRQFPQRLEIVSPGGFLPGISPDNFLWKQAPRNRRIAESFARCGLVERAGQGADRMFEACILESKPRPDFAGTDDYQVALTLHGQVQDPRFLRLLERLGPDRRRSFGIQDLLVLDAVRRELPVGPEATPRLNALVDQGIVERVGRGPGTRYILSRELYGFLGEQGTYTRKKGLDHETNKALLLKHIRDSGQDGAPLQELTQVLPALSRRQVRLLLAELRAEERVQLRGRTKSGRWVATRED